MQRVFYDLFKYFTNENRNRITTATNANRSTHRLNMQPNRMNVCSYLHSENIKFMYDFIESDNLMHAASQTSLPFDRRTISNDDGWTENGRRRTEKEEKQRISAFQLDSIFDGFFLYTRRLWRPDRFIAVHSMFESAGFCVRVFVCVFLHI